MIFQLAVYFVDFIDFDFTQCSRKITKLSRCKRRDELKLLKSIDFARNFTFLVLLLFRRVFSVSIELQFVIHLSQYFLEVFLLLLLLLGKLLLFDQPLRLAFEPSRDLVTKFEEDFVILFLNKFLADIFWLNDPLLILYHSLLECF